MRSLPLLIVPVLVWLSGVPAVGDVGDAWRSNGPDGGSVYALAVDPQESAVVYAGTGDGVFKSENDNELVINTPQSGLVTVKKKDIETRQKSLSPMPEGMAQILSKRDLRDLIAYLSTLK